MLGRVRQHYELLQSTTGNTQGGIDRKDFERYLKRIALDKEECKRWYTVLDSTNDG